MRQQEETVPASRRSTRDVAAVSGYSTQQVRNLENTGVIPEAARQPNGYRSFDESHITALRAYRRLALAIGPVSARGTMRDIRRMARGDALAVIGELHIGIARSRRDTVLALAALDMLIDESDHDVAAEPGDEMTITELSTAIGVRSSALRFWEQQGLITPQRAGAISSRRYSPDAVRDARVIAALRAGGYRIPAIHAVLSSLRIAGNPDTARAALHSRLHAIAAQSEALLLAGTDLVRGLENAQDRRSSGTIFSADTQQRSERQLN